MFSIASQIAINFGYKNLHHIEYDCELLDTRFLEENVELLKEYDSVICTDDGTEHGFLFGSIKSFRVSSLPEKFKNYDKDFIREEIKITDPKQLEPVTKKLFINSGKVFFRNEPSEDKFKRGDMVLNRNLHYTLYYNSLDKTLNIFYNSIINSSEDIVIIVNKTHIINLTTEPYHWNIRVDNSQKVIYDKTFDNEFREIFKIKSYIINV